MHVYCEQARSLDGLCWFFPEGHTVWYIYILSNSRKNEQTGWVTVTINLTANSNPTGKRGRVD